MRYWRILRDEDETCDLLAESRLKKCNTLRHYLDTLGLHVRSDARGGVEHPDLVYETIAGEQQNSFVGPVYVALVHKSSLPEEHTANLPEQRSNFPSMLTRRMDRASRANSRTCEYITIDEYNGLYHLFD